MISTLPRVTRFSLVPRAPTLARQMSERSSDDPPLYDGHIPTSLVQKLILAGGSSIISLTAPWRGDMVAVSGEVLPGTETALRSLHDKMVGSEEGARVLSERPLITAASTASLHRLPAGTVGRTYADWMKGYNYSPDDRCPVQFVDDPDLAYVMTRYRQTHDLTHAVLGMPTTMVGEVVVKMVEGMQTGLPMCVLGGILGPVRFTDRQREQYRKLLPWVESTGAEAELFLNVFYENRWEQDLQDFKRERNIKEPPLKLL